MFRRMFYPGECDGQTSATTYGRTSQWEGEVLDATGPDKRIGQRFWIAHSCYQRYPISFLYVICSFAVTRSSIQLPLLVRRL